MCDIVVRRKGGTVSPQTCDHCKELKKQLDDKETECVKLEKKLNERDENLKGFQNVLEPACKELYNLNEQLLEEQKNRHDAEKLAKHVQASNTKLKRQSQTLLQNLQKFDSFSVTKVIDLKVDNDVSMEAKLAEIETERNLLSRKVERNKIEYSEKIETLEKRNQELTNKVLDSLNKIEELQNLINSFRRTSTLAIEEFTKLQDLMEEEVTKKETAQKYALDCSAREKAIHHQSTVLMSDNSSDGKLFKLLLEIEDLSKELTFEKEKHKREVTALEMTLKESRDVEKIVAIETRLEISNSEMERLHRSVVELEKWKEEAVVEMNTLRQRCEEVSIPLPPPPPPPPLPCQPPTPSIPWNANKIKKSVSSDGGPAAAESSNQEKLLNDLKAMMNKIKNGDKLANSQTVKLPQKVQKNELPPALMELQSVLAKMKTKEPSHKKSDDTSPDTTVHKTSAPQAPTQKPKGVCKTLSSQTTF